MVIKVAVLGAGINGVTCAVKIKEKYQDIEVDLISNKFTPNTTGDGSGGLWYPYLCGNTSEALLTKWGGDTYKYLHGLWLEGGHDICFIPIYSLYRGKVDFQPEWSTTVFGFEKLGKRRLEYLSSLYSVEYAAGHTFTTFVVRPAKIIDHLHRRFARANGRVVRAEVASLRDPILEQYHVVVNCTGLASKELVPDSSVFPIRGQITKVKAPWINACVLDDYTGNYILPNAETVVLGGTHQEHDFNTSVDEKDNEFILNGCQSMILGLKDAEIVDTWVGLRPGRLEIRLDAEESEGKLYIHNYGHGGSGLTLFWGCGSEVLQLLEQHLDLNKNSVIVSKL